MKLVFLGSPTFDACTPTEVNRFLIKKIVKRITQKLVMNLVMRKPVFKVSHKVRHKPGYTTTECGKRLEISHLGRTCRGIVLQVSLLRKRRP